MVAVPAFHTVRFGLSSMTGGQETTCKPTNTEITAERTPAVRKTLARRPGGLGTGIQRASPDRWTTPISYRCTDRIQIHSWTQIRRSSKSSNCQKYQRDRRHRRPEDLGIGWDRNAPERRSGSFSPRRTLYLLLFNTRFLFLRSVRCALHVARQPPSVIERPLAQFSEKS